MIAWFSVVHLQAHGPHVARHSVCSGPWSHSRKIFKSEICRKACRVTFVSLHCLRRINCILHNNNSYFFCVPFCFAYLFHDQIQGTSNLCFFGAPAFVVLKCRLHLAQWTQYRQKNPSIYPLHAAFSMWPSRQYLQCSVQFIYASRPSTEYFIRNTGTGSDGRSRHLRHCNG